jgi:hypothetical protein
VVETVDKNGEIAMNLTESTVAIYGIDPKIRLKLKLLATVHGKTMAKMCETLIEEAYERDETQISRKSKSKLRRIIRRWA